MEAYLALLVKDWAVVLSVARSCYEAFALTSFVQLMLAYASLSTAANGDHVVGAKWFSMDIRSDPQVRCPVPPWPEALFG